MQTGISGKSRAGRSHGEAQGPGGAPLALRFSRQRGFSTARAGCPRRSLNPEDEVRPFSQRPLPAAQGNRVTLRVGRLGSPATAQGLLRWGQGRLREGPCAGGGCLKPALVYHFLRPSPSEGWRACTPPRRGSPRHCRLPPPRPAIRRGPRCRVVSRDTIAGDVRPGLGSHDPCPRQPEGTRAHIAHQPVRRAGPPAGGCLRAASFTHSLARQGVHSGCRRKTRIPPA